MTRQFVLLNINGFRGMTTDIDALILASSAMEDAILRVEEKYGLPHGWLNADFTRTESYLAEHEKRGTRLTMKQIKKALADLYGDWDALPEKSQRFLEDVMNDGHVDALYQQVSASEQDAHNALLRFEKDYPGVTNEANVDEIIKALQAKKG